MAWFRISFAENAFRRLLKARELSLETLTVEDAIAAMRDFHTEHRAQHTVGGEDSLSVRHSAKAVTIKRRMTRSDDGGSRTLILTVGPEGAHLSFS